jgi:uncharacterized protein (TIGR03437 family)
MRVALPAWVVYWLLGAPGALAGQLALPVAPATPGTRLILPVAFTSQDGSIAGLQFDVQYDSAAMSVAAAADDAAATSGKSLYQAGLAPNKRRFLIVGPNQNPIPNGTPINLLVYLNPNASGGSYPLIFSNIVATDRYGLAEPASGVDGAVTVQAAIGVVNGASLLPGPVAPGEVVRLVGAWSGLAPAETRVLFDGIPALLVSAAPGAIEATVPDAVSGKAATRLEATSGGRVIADVLLPAAGAAPGIFTLDGSGIGPGAVLNQGPSVNSPSNPAARGDVVTLFATGIGQKLPVSVRIGGVEAEVQYAGAAPTFFAGVDLVKCRIPANAASGLAVPVVIKAGTAGSQPGVTLAVQ